MHVIATDGGDVIATCRLRRVEGNLKLERMCVERGRRGTGVGTELLGEAERIARELGARRVLMHAQTHARGFYERNGYRSEGELFIEAGIEHVRMSKPLAGAR